MGQKVNPVGFRVGVTHAWGSRWFAPKKMFGAFLVEDQKIRDVCKKRLADAVQRTPWRDHRPQGR